MPAKNAREGVAVSEDRYGVLQSEMMGQSMPLNMQVFETLFKDRLSISSLALETKKNMVIIGRRVIKFENEPKLLLEKKTGTKLDFLCFSH